MCPPASNTGTYNLASSNAQHVRDGSCDFGQGPCGYTQGCRQGMAPEWKHRAQGYFEMRANESGGGGRTSVLNSPFLDISRPSCLSFTAFPWQPVHLAVVLSTAHTNCTTLTKQTFPNGGNKSFDVDLPPGVARIMFQGFHGGDNIHYARIYNVFVEAGCCQDPDWFSVVNHKGINPDHPHCSWTVTGMTINPNLGAAVGNNATDGTLTTPLIRATSPGETDCLTFEYFLSYYDGNSLTACIMDTQNVFRPVWTMSNKNNTGFGELELLKGQIPVSSSAFKIRFTGRREVMTDDAIVAIRNVRYTRGSTKAQCSLMPLGAFAPANLSCIVSEPHADQGHSNAGAITGGVIVAVLIVLAIAIGGFIFWRRRNKQRDHQETDPHNSPDTATPLPHADEPIVSPENYERLNAVSEQREYAVLQAAPRQPTDSTYYELPSGEGPAVAGTAGRNPNYQNLPVPENGLSDTANAGSAEGGDGSNNDYLTPVLTMPAAVNTASK